MKEQQWVDGWCEWIVIVEICTNWARPNNKVYKNKGFIKLNYNAW